jgi:hypothetical protein
MKADCVLSASDGQAGKDRDGARHDTADRHTVDSIEAADRRVDGKAGRAVSRMVELILLHALMPYRPEQSERHHGEQGPFEKRGICARGIAVEPEAQTAPA